MKAKGEVWFIAGIVIFAFYFFGAARPIPFETVLVPRWLNSLESGKPVPLGETLVGASQGGFAENNADSLQSFILGGHFGYIDRDGNFAVNQIKKANVSLSGELWAEYEAQPERITIYSSSDEVFTVIEDPRGYPFFLDGRIFLINSEQNAISEIDPSGAVSWTYEFASPLTCVDSASGLLIAGSLDGIVGVLDNRGRQVFSFEPGGSRYSAILGCAISRDGSRIAIISGVDAQRFLVLERFGTNTGDYKVVYHEFLDDGFRRPVYISFIEMDRWVIFERTGGLGLYEISSRNVTRVELNGEVSAVDNSGGQGMVFVVISRLEDQKELIGIRLPGRVIIESPFKTDEVFLGRIDSRLIVGGGQTLVSFDLEKR
jgi:hypothetical protein